MKTFLDEYLILGIDFDGTITTEGHIGETMELQPHCKDVLTKLKDTGKIKLVLWTCRTGKLFDDAIEFLKENDMYHLFDAFNDQIPEIRERYYPKVARKLGADFYIDDRNLGTVIDWKRIEEQVLNHLVSIFPEVV